MPWLDRPAAVYTRYEVVLHRLDEPYVLSTQHPTTGNQVVYEVWELRMHHAFDAMQGRWEATSVKPFGYRKGQRGAPRQEIRGTSPEIRALAAKYAPDWIPDPAKPRLQLPAEDVFAEAKTMMTAAVTDMVGLTDAVRARMLRLVESISNPYEGE